MADEAVVAAGTLVLHDGGVLLVHRPKYDDWSFPKGKQEAGEPDVVTAVRETVEETGVEVRLGRPLTSQSYVQRDGRPKVVRYWRAEVTGDPDVSRYVANQEVDEVAWVPEAEVATRLTYRRDTLVLDDALRHRAPTTPLILLRHAKSLSRKSWDDEDPLRPLSQAGHEQALAVATMLAAYGVTRVVTSSSTRCVQTVTPYATEHVLQIYATSVLAEEHDGNPQDACALLEELLADPEPTVTCTHRPLLPELLRHLHLAVPTMSPADLVVVHHHGGQAPFAELHEAP